MESPTLKIQSSIRWKLIIAITIPLILISVILALTLRSIYQYGSDNLQQQGLSEMNLYAARINAEFQSLARVAQDTANFLSIEANLDEPSIYELLSNNVEQSSLIYGSAIAFEPYGFDPNLRLFSPYVYVKNNTLTSLDIGSDSYDYSDGNWDWFSSAKEQQVSLWTEPFFDEGAGDILMVTFSAPFYTDGQFRGVATIDVSLAELRREAALELSNQLFAIQSESGKFISHYDADLIMSSSLQEQAALLNDPAYQEIVNNILAGENGIGFIDKFLLNGTVINDKSWIFYAPIASTGWTLSTMATEASITSGLSSLTTLGLLGVALLILITFILVWIISNNITTPIETLALAVEEVAQGKLDTPIKNISSTDEIGKLATGFSLMLANLNKQISIQSEQNADKQLVIKELQMARETQTSLLPSEFPPFPERKEFELHAVNQAARHVAGDFFDYFFINPKTLIFVIADVSGKGMSAALVMAVTSTIIRNLAKSGKTPAQILTETNERLIERHKGKAFVTIFLGSYNINNGKIIYANGGHSSAYRISLAGKVSSFGEATGTIVGMLEDQEYLNANIRLLPGESLLLYTDGMSEARTPSGEFYGEERIKALLTKNAGASPSVLCETAVKEICDFQEHNLSDDLTILALKRMPTKMSKIINELRNKKSPSKHYKTLPKPS